MGSFVEVTASMAAPLRGEKRWAYLTRARTIRVATTCEDGSIHLSPLWFVVHEKTIYVPIDVAGRHAVNFDAGRPMAALVDSGEEYATVMGVRIVGKMERVEDPKLFERLQQLLFDKYFYVGHPYADPCFQFGNAVGRKYYALRAEKMVGWDSRETTTPQVTESHVLPDFVTDRRLNDKK